MESQANDKVTHQMPQDTPEAGTEISPYKVNQDGTVMYYPEIQHVNFVDMYNQHHQILQSAKTQQIAYTLSQLVQSDPFNAYCIDCKKNLADHATITFGLFICGLCANRHRDLLGMEKSYVKSLYNEHWDEYQLKFMQQGGNKAYHEFIQYYELDSEEIKKKYEHRASQWWSKKLRAQIDQKSFDHKPPSKKGDWKDKTMDILKVGEQKSQVYIVKAGEQLEKGGKWIQDQWKTSGASDKFKELFGGKKK